MKKPFYKLSILFITIFFIWSCEDYLERSPESETSLRDVFSTYADFQGFIEPLYFYVLDYTRDINASSFDIGGEVVHGFDRSVFTKSNFGDYTFWMGGTVYSMLINGEKTGLWDVSWPAIRVANMALSNLHLLSDATEEERNLIEGQALFFRAFFHFEMIKLFGPLPYIDEVLAANESYQLSRYFDYKGKSGWQACAEKIVEDFDKAATLLPADWDQTGPGRLRPGSSVGRATKGAALAFKAKTLLYAGSPLMSSVSGKGLIVDPQYMERAAEAAWQVLAMDTDNGGNIYHLTPWGNYQKMFTTTDGTIPYTRETVFFKPRTPYLGNHSDPVADRRLYRNQMTRLHIPSLAIFGGQGQTAPYNCGVTQHYVDLFEMADGTIYNPIYDNDNDKRWNNRDPRFRKSIYVDGDNAGFAPRTILELFDGGATKGNRSFCLTSYVIHKYWPRGVDETNNTGYRVVNPHMRLADVYLMYAEAVNEVYGPNGSAPVAGGFTAVDAVNKVRNRAGMPPVSSAHAGYPGFRELVLNERAVELCFEGHYWFDTRRWYIAHTLTKELQDLSFDRDYTNFSRVTVQSRTFDLKHYWLPLPLNQVQMYQEMYQNPGW